MKSFASIPTLPSSTLSEPVSQLQADFVLRDGDSGPTVEVSCLASSGSPPITYRLVGNDGRVLAQQMPIHGKPANFSLPLSQTSSWFQCKAENNVSVDSSARIPLPQGEQVLLGLEQEVIRCLGLGQLNLATAEGRTSPSVACCMPLLLLYSRGPVQVGNLPPRGAAPHTHLYSGWQPHLHRCCCFQDAELDQVSHVGEPLTTPVTSQCPEWEQQVSLVRLGLYNKAQPEAAY